MNLPKLTRSFHKWLSLFVGIQVLAWAAGGFVMSYFPIAKVRGEYLINNAPEAPITNDEIKTPPQDILAMHATNGAGVRAIKVKRSLGRMVYELFKIDGTLDMIDANTGEMLSPIPRELAMAYAQHDFTGQGKPVSVQFLIATNTEYHKAVPVWRIDFDNEENTHLYVSPRNGEILARRTDTWRLYDFFWMLHIMDYKNRSDFNHPLLIGAAALAVIMVISGILLIFTSFRARDFGLIRNSNNR